jgi:L,D-transpeptidase ErfK/SrfK
MIPGAKSLFLALAVLLLWCSPSASAGVSPLVGGDTLYEIRKGDTINRIGAKLGVSTDAIMRDNDINEKTVLRVGRNLKVNTRKIVPKVAHEGIIINIPDRTLYFFKDGRLENSFPVGLGMPKWRDLTEWRTPEGRFRIIAKEKDPTWFVPESMQWKMIQEGKDILDSVPPGPENPLGRYVLKTSLPGILIHGTIWPASIYRFQSHGCIRVLPEQMEPFYAKVSLNTEGEIIYVPVKAAVTDDGRVFLEAHRDFYRKAGDYRVEAKRRIEELGVSGKVRWDKIETVLQDKAGVAVDVTM